MSRSRNWAGSVGLAYCCRLLPKIDACRHLEYAQQPEHGGHLYRIVQKRKLRGDIALAGLGLSGH